MHGRDNIKSFAEQTTLAGESFGKEMVQAFRSEVFYSQVMSSWDTCSEV